jgi:hypothetical protein
VDTTIPRGPFKDNPVPAALDVNARAEALQSRRQLRQRNFSERPFLFPLFHAPLSRVESTDALNDDATNFAWQEGFSITARPLAGTNWG